jgi:hypothetical protein
VGDTELLDTLEFLRKCGNEIPDEVWVDVENAFLQTFIP